MVPSALVVALALCPVVGLIAPIVFFWLWPRKLQSASELGAGDVARDVGESTKISTLVFLFRYGSLACGTLLWVYFFPLSPAGVGFFTNRWLSSALLSGYLGVSWAGVSIWLLTLGILTGRMRREIPGLMAPLKMQAAVWMAGALAEELWRVVTITAMLTSQYSPVFSVFVVSLAFGSAYLGLGLQGAAVATLDGTFFGLLFLLRGSFFAPFAAHLAVQGVYLWGVGQFAPDEQSRRTWQIPGTKCPVCGTSLRLVQIKLADVFECPVCNEPISLSDGYRNAMRFGGAIGFCALIVFNLVLLNTLVPERLIIWLVYPISYGVATSGLFLYRRAFTRLFPPQLQRGTPYFIGLNLKDRHPPKSGNGEGHNI